MSNVAGKAYAMNVITPIRSGTTWLNKLIFWVAARLPSTLKGLVTLSLIHYAHWAIVGRKQFPRLSQEQPEEDLKYAYMMFFSNFNGSWDQYVDSFSFAIPSGLDMFWKWNVRYPRSISLTPFHQYIQHNQIETIHYYSAYPLATANDIKSAATVKAALVDFESGSDASDEAFMRRYRALLRALQHDLGDMAPTPIVSMSANQVERRERWRARHADDPGAAPNLTAVGAHHAR